MAVKLVFTECQRCIEHDTLIESLGFIVMLIMTFHSSITEHRQFQENLDRAQISSQGKIPVL